LVRGGFLMWKKTYIFTKLRNTRTHHERTACVPRIIRRRPYIILHTPTCNIIIRVCTILCTCTCVHHRCNNTYIYIYSIRFITIRVFTSFIRYNIYKYMRKKYIVAHPTKRYFADSGISSSFRFLISVFCRHSSLWREASCWVYTAYIHNLHIIMYTLYN